MNQWLTVARIGGKSAVEIRRLFERWRSQRRSDPRDPEIDVWPREAQEHMREFATALAANAAFPPVVSCRKHCDAWLMGPDFSTILLAERDPNAIALDIPGGEMFCYPLPDDGALEARVRSVLHRRRKGVGDEERRWFARAVLEALEFWWTPKVPSVLVIIREVIDGLIEDREIEASFGEIAAWLQPFCETDRSRKKDRTIRTRGKRKSG